MAIAVVDFAKCGLLVERDEDIGQEAYESAGVELYKAFRTTGFAYIRNAGITEKTLDDVNATAADFFSLPLDEKMKYSKKRINFGYDANKSARTYQGTEVYQEAFRATPQNPDDEWPVVPHFEERCRNFADTCKRLTLRILKALGVGMKLKDKDYLWKIHTLMNERGNSTVLKVIRYPPVEQDDGPFRINAHTDFGSITLLFQDEIGGLQVQSPDGSFVDAKPIPGTIVVNTADVIQTMSGERLKSTIHRVIKLQDPVKQSMSRKVIVYFVQPDHHVVMNELEFEDEVDEIPAAKKNPNPVTVLEHVQMRFQRAFIQSKE